MNIPGFTREPRYLMTFARPARLGTLYLTFHPAVVFGFVSSILFVLVRYLAGHSFAPELVEFLRDWFSVGIVIAGFSALGSVMFAVKTLAFGPRSSACKFTGFDILGLATAAFLALGAVAF
ncbi:hypothetical protein ABIC83_002975 [Roseateles asaccharophilus]|uniref:hypothetical protein n=1 Tax=Roseateles asaccharophilus TaxID=582607 RepID=UPI0038336860